MSTLTTTTEHPMIATIESTTNDTLRAKVEERLRAEPRLMTPLLARELGIPEAELFRLLPVALCTELDIANGGHIRLLKALERLGRVHVIASNDAVTLEAYGRFGGFSLTGPYFNVQTDTLDMHLLHTQLASAFALAKPSHQDGQPTYSIQFFTPAGRSAFKVFLYKSVTGVDGHDLESSMKEWENIRTEFQQHHAA